MAGLIDSATGLGFGLGLQFQTNIGTAFLDIHTDVPVFLVASDGALILASDGAGVLVPSTYDPDVILASDGATMLSSDGQIIATQAFLQTLILSSDGAAIFASDGTDLITS